MSWKDNMRPGSFRGVPFQVTKHSMPGGRRGVHHVYAGRDNGYVEDLGLKDKKFSIDVFVIGDDYMSARDKLMQALDEPGPGSLVHPWLGSHRVSLDPGSGYSLSESVSEGRVARFTIGFIKTETFQYPSVSKSSALATLEAGKISKSAGLTDFLSTFRTKGIPDFVAGGAAEIIGQFQTVLDDLAGGLKLAGAPLADFQDTMVSLRNSLTETVYEPQKIGEIIQSLLTFGDSISSSPAGVIPALEEIVIWTETLPSVLDITGDVITPSRLIQEANQSSLKNLIKTTSAVLMAETMTAAEFESYDTAYSALTKVTDTLDAVIETAPDTVFATLENVRSSVNTDVTTRAANLARLVNIQVPVTLSSLIVAYDLYEDLAPAEDLVSRNRLSHPGKVPAATSLEVLSHA